jgi:hypothetical protein
VKLRLNLNVNSVSQNYLLATLLVSTLLLTVPAPAQSQNGQGGGSVLPPSEKPQGYSLEDMAKLMALFTTSGNDPSHYPKTPFQILYGKPGITKATPKACPQPPGGTGFLNIGGNAFVVRPETSFFVPLSEFDDSPPVVGLYPSHKSQVPDYIFGPLGYGARDYNIIVDGHKTPVGPEFLAGPVETPPLLNGGGTHSIQLGVFLTPMSVGIHLVTITGEVASDAFYRANNFGCVAQLYTYVVAVVPGH